MIFSYLFAYPINTEFKIMIPSRTEKESSKTPVVFYFFDGVMGIVFTSSL